MNPTAEQIINEAITQLDKSSLEQIARHCEFNIDLALKYSENNHERIALVKSEKKNMLSMLAASCRQVIEHKIKTGEY